MNWKLVKSLNEYEKYSKEFFAEKTCYDSNYLHDIEFKQYLSRGETFPFMVSFIQTEYCSVMDNQAWRCVWFSYKDASELIMRATEIG
jgi:hypothetical protein